MKADPRFPNRPTHPDFDRLSGVVCGIDDAVDAARDKRAAFFAHVNDVVDIDAVTYLAMQRNGNEPARAACYLDGFIAGALYERGDSDATNWADDCPHLDGITDAVRQDIGHAPCPICVQLNRRQR